VPAVGRADREVHLEQLVATALEPVLALGEVADLGLHRAVAQRGQVVVAERKPPADERVLVRIDDAPGGVPELDEHDAVHHHPPVDDAVEPAQRARVARLHGLRHLRRHHALADDARELARVADRLLGAGVAGDGDADDRDDGGGEQPGADELEDGGAG
jgi:hypothetical protein